MKLKVLLSSTVMSLAIFLANPVNCFAQKASYLDEFTFNSQVGQDQLVYMILYGLQGKSDQGYYLEIGAGEPIYINNSYLFEKEFGWKGVSIDISEDLAQRWYAVRKNTVLSEDAVKSNYNAILKNFPKVIDYLSLDVDGYYTDVLKKLPLDRYTFKIITIEHDFYRYGDLYRSGEREILKSFGYHLLCSDVSQNGLSFEDWWIHPSCFTAHELELITSIKFTDKNYTQILQELYRGLVQ